jgi:hypothetical protein
VLERRIVAAVIGDTMGFDQAKDGVAIVIEMVVLLRISDCSGFARIGLLLSMGMGRAT